MTIHVPTYLHVTVRAIAQGARARNGKMERFLMRCVNVFNSQKCIRNAQSWFSHKSSAADSSNYLAVCFNIDLYISPAGLRDLFSVRGKVFHFCILMLSHLSASGKQFHTFLTCPFALVRYVENYYQRCGNYTYSCAGLWEIILHSYFFHTLNFYNELLHIIKL